MGPIVTEPTFVKGGRHRYHLFTGTCAKDFVAIFKLPHLKHMLQRFFFVVVNRMVHILGGCRLTTFFGRRGTQRGPSHSPFYPFSAPSQVYALHCLAGTVLGIFVCAFTWCVFRLQQTPLILTSEGCGALGVFGDALFSRNDTSRLSLCVGPSRSPPSCGLCRVFHR